MSTRSRPQRENGDAGRKSLIDDTSKRFQSPPRRFDSDRSASERPWRPMPANQIRDGIIEIDPIYGTLLHDILVHASRKTHVRLRLLSRVSDATIPEKNGICLPPDMEPYRDRLQQCDTIIYGLPNAVFSGSGFGINRDQARASSAKDLTDKCGKLNIFPISMFAIYAQNPEISKKELPFFEQSVETFSIIADEVVLGPPDILTAPDLEPQTVIKLRAMLEEAVVRAAKRCAPRSVPSDRSDPRTMRSRRPERSERERCKHCGGSGHSVRECAIYIQEMELKRRQADVSHFPVERPYNGPLLGAFNPPPIIQRQVPSLMSIPVPLIPHNPVQLIHTSLSAPKVYTEEDVLRRVRQELDEKERSLQEDLRVSQLMEQKLRLEAKLREEAVVHAQNEAMNRMTPLGGAIASSSAHYTTAPFLTTAPAPAPRSQTSKADVDPLAPSGNKINWTSRRGPNGYGLGTAFGLLWAGRKFVIPSMAWLDPADPLARVPRVISDCEEVIQSLERRIETQADADHLSQLMVAVQALGDQAKSFSEVRQLEMLTELHKLLKQALDERKKRGGSQRERDRERERERERERSSSRRRRSRSRSRTRRRSRSRSSGRSRSGPVRIMVDGRELVCNTEDTIVQTNDRIWAQDMHSGTWEDCRVMQVLPRRSGGSGEKLVLGITRTGKQWTKLKRETFRSAY
ncbi:unnamed protein product, partial [Mesorhabditis spiculigera]